MAAGHLKPEEEVEKCSQALSALTVQCVFFDNTFIALYYKELHIVHVLMDFN